MGWFDEQIKLRKKNDDAILEESFVGMADAVLGTKMSEAYKSDAEKADSAIDYILRYYKIKPVEVPDNFKNLNDRLEYLLRPNGIMCRNVTLEKAGIKTQSEQFWAQEKMTAVLLRLFRRVLRDICFLTHRQASG